MSVGTTLVDFKKALVDALSARSVLIDDQVRITYDMDQEYVADKSIWFENANSSDRIPTMRAGVKTVEERYSVSLVIQVLASEGADQETADVAAVRILAEVQQCLAENPQLLPEIMWADLGGWDHKTGVLPKGDGRGSGFDVKINVRARLRP